MRPIREKNVLILRVISLITTATCGVETITFFTSSGDGIRSSKTGVNGGVNDASVAVTLARSVQDFKFMTGDSPYIYV